MVQTYSYGRRLPGLRLGASRERVALTPPLNLPAPGRCQSLYVASSTLQRPVFLVNSRLGHFSAARLESGREVHFPHGHPLSRSYGVILPSSFAKTHSSTLGYSPCLRVSVSGTVTGSAPIEVFLGSMIRASLWACALPIAPRNCPPGFAWGNFLHA